VFVGADQPPSGTALEFWRWAYGDLLDDDVKGAFAEWMVHRLLGVVSERRVSWANSDVITPEGVRIEVKSTAFWQSWKLLDEFGRPEATPKHPVNLDAKKIRFQGLKARDSTAVPDSSKMKSFKSHLYVFVFQNNPDPMTWNALDLRQWEFYLLPASKLIELGWQSISLATLRHKFQRMSADEFATQGRAAIQAEAARVDALCLPPEGH
jgi:hypothetical protein